ncbi:MAG: rhodanese-related sulfurtransferase [Chlamydiota bacterium]
MVDRKDFSTIVLAFYKYVELSDPKGEVQKHKDFFTERDITSRIYISEEGINGQMSASHKDAKAYIDWMHSRSEFKDVQFKLHYWHEQVFPKQTVKYRKQLVAIEESVDIANTGTHLSPQEWKEMLETSNDHILIDVRNDYEWEVGHFEGAELPKCATFREFKEYAENLETTTDKKKPVMMYCTGGIRCEIYSAVLKEKGFENVYQLDGGIINYGLKEGSKKWLGKLFVFDDRLTVPISDEDPDVISKCHQCGCQTDNYYNCANMDCNKLYICCNECLEKLKGCCCESCTDAPRLRPYHQQNPHKPFRKYHHYFGQKSPPQTSQTPSKVRS